MSDLVLNIDLRERIGKGGAREARRNGLIPGVIYGGKDKPVAISFKKNEVIKALNTGSLLSQMVQISHEGKKQKVICQDIQFHPVTDMPHHIDLFRVKDNQIISVEVAVHFINEDAAPGLKTGGTLNIVRHSVEINVPAGKIPEYLTGDLTGLEIGDNVKISNIELPDGASPTISDRDFTIATIAGRGGAVAKADDAEDAAAEEGEAEA